jgi:RNA polymerase sigma-70 factor (ECF subfamily)
MNHSALLATTYHALDDRTIAGMCAVRDEGALRFVIAANNQRLFRAAWSVLKDRADAEEALQAGYLSAFAAIGGFEGRCALSTWLTRIVVNEALGRRRAARRRQASFEQQGVALLDTYREKLMRGSEPTPPDAALAREQLRRLLEAAIADLPVAYRTVFVLREVEGLSVEQTSEVLAIAAGTVKTRLLRARRRLRSALAPELHDALEGTFPFAGAECAAMADWVIDRIRNNRDSGSFTPGPASPSEAQTGV